MITKEKLEEYASKLMFKMNDEEYKTLEKEFDIILKQMDLIEKIDGIKEVEPMTFPNIPSNLAFREDEIKDTLTTEEVLLNVKESNHNQVKVPKVVE